MSLFTLASTFGEEGAAGIEKGVATSLVFVLSVPLAFPTLSRLATSVVIVLVVERRRAGITVFSVVPTTESSSTPTATSALTTAGTFGEECLGALGLLLLLVSLLAFLLLDLG